MKETPPSGNESVNPVADLPFSADDHWTYPVEFDKPLDTPEENWEKKAHLLIGLSDELVKNFAQGYSKDPFFKNKCADEIPSPQTPITPSHFRKSKEGLIYFMDADWSSRLCVPKDMINFALKWIHDEASESAHAG
ncbi:hypothetical protein HYPSUDRAFT_148703, partial [Hypholoma sublateritium FD-334 SS-4]